MAGAGLVLVVDDNQVNRLILTRLLTSQGLASIEAENGKRALEILRESREPAIDVVLLDVLMPEMDGYETLAAIKGDEALRHLPVIVISGVEELESAVRCIELGATDYLTKPYNPAILGARIRASLVDKRLHDLEFEYLERQTAMNEVLEVISTSAFDLRTVLATVVETAARLCRAEYGSIWLAESGLFRVAANVGESTALLEAQRARGLTPGRGTVVGRVALSRAPVQIIDVLTDADYEQTELQRVAGFRTLLGVPIQRDGDLIGVILAARNHVLPFTESEILLVTAFADQAAIGIQNVRQVETIGRQKEELSRFLSPQVASLISSPEGEEMLAGHRRQATVVFCDLRGFTAFSETAEPEELFGVLRDYHGAMGSLIVEHGGTLEHFAGDGMMIFFNDPVAQPDHATRAVRMAVAMRERFVDLATVWRKRGYELGFGVGIAVGYATLGRIGFEGRFDYGAIGNVTILASRLCSEAQSGQILLSQRAYAAVEDIVEAEAVGELTLKGLSRPVPALNVMSLKAREPIPAS